MSRTCHGTRTDSRQLSHTQENAAAEVCRRVFANDRRDAKDEGEWVMVQRELLYSTADSDVYRLTGSLRRGPMIVKVTSDTRIQRLIAAHAVLSHVSAVWVPELMWARSDGQCGMAVFPDIGLEPVCWTEALAHDASRLLARLHRSSVETSTTGVSHTPSISIIISAVRTKRLAEWEARLRDHGLSQAHLPLLKEHWDGSERLREQLATYQKVWSHGDAHAGNFMWHPSEQKLYVIDWEFAHYDLPFFDLYQLMDATSPTQPLFCSNCMRVSLLLEYWRTAEVKKAFAAFHCDYLAYALWHHLWILSRIEADFETGKFGADALRRQWHETVTGIVNMLNEWNKSHCEG